MRVSSPVFACLLLAFASADAFINPSGYPQPPAAATKTTTSLQDGKGPFSILGGIGETLSKEIGSLLNKPKDDVVTVEKSKPKLPDVVINPDYKLGAIFLIGGILLDLIPYIQFTLGPIVTLLGILFVVQTARIRFCFDSEAFELRTDGGDGNLERPGENIVVGGENRWTYDSFVNYEFYPEGWVDQPQGPILVYFKETQTPSENWSDGPGKSANSEEALAKGAKPGQVHFFPALCDCQQLKAEFERRGCAKL
jgi:Protein of unknown function (DUF3119)